MVMPFFFYKGGKTMEKYGVIKFKDDEFELVGKKVKVGTKQFGLIQNKLLVYLEEIIKLYANILIMH